MWVLPVLAVKNWEQFLNLRRPGWREQALFLSPTRELAEQSQKVRHWFRQLRVPGGERLQVPLTPRITKQLPGSLPFFRGSGTVPSWSVQELLGLLWVVPNLLCTILDRIPERIGFEPDCRKSSVGVSALIRLPIILVFVRWFRVKCLFHGSCLPVCGSQCAPKDTTCNIDILLEAS